MAAEQKIEAGEYELVAERWDEITSKPGQPFEFIRHTKGDIVTLNAEDARRFVLAGAVVEPGSIERAQVEALRAQLQAALAALPPSVREAAEGSDVSVVQATVTPAVPGQTVGGPVPEGSAGVPAGSGSTGDPAADAAAEEGADEAALPEHIRGMTVEDLKTYAATNDIEVKGLTLKGDLQKAIVEAESK